MRLSVGSGASLKVQGIILGTLLGSLSYGKYISTRPRVLGTQDPRIHILMGTNFTSLKKLLQRVLGLLGLLADGEYIRTPIGIKKLGVGLRPK